MKVLPHDQKILVFIGPSGAGKSTVVQALARKGVVEVTPTWTTRPPRKDEREETVEHHFTSEKEFVRLQKNGFFLETAQPFGLKFIYGLPEITANFPDRIPTIMLRSFLLERLSKHYPNFVVYQIEDDVERIRKRLQARQEAGEQLGTRLVDYEKEISLGRKVAGRVFENEELDVTVQAIEETLKEDFYKIRGG